MLLLCLGCRGDRCFVAAPRQFPSSLLGFNCSEFTLQTNGHSCEGELVFCPPVPCKSLFVLGVLWFCYNVSKCRLLFMCYVITMGLSRLQVVVCERLCIFAFPRPPMSPLPCSRCHLRSTRDGRVVGLNLQVSEFLSHVFLFVSTLHSVSFLWARLLHVLSLPP